MPIIQERSGNDVLTEYQLEQYTNKTVDAAIIILNFKNRNIDPVIRFPGLTEEDQLMSHINFKRDSYMFQVALAAANTVIDQKYRTTRDRLKNLVSSEIKKQMIESRLLLDEKYQALYEYLMLDINCEVLFCYIFLVNKLIKIPKKSKSKS